ncbi:MAG: RdgB/HAM1 family non-canonical purine NTP pyrophosphatase [Candidatus Thorarchaeota archaeon]|nr:RdgB/HAM1 family non-canonical purine NTP pyrophosphatase [Candidatus Thorarchaeota archaeon]
MSKAKIVLLTHNPHKIEELTPLFRRFDVDFETTSLEKFEIRSDSVEEIARVAALSAFKELGRPVVLDDTGFFIDALNGFPRSYPAFVLETIGRAGILKLMKGVEDRSARFITAVGYTQDGVTATTFVGEMPGVIALEEAGSGGFGYDPIFIPERYDLTYAQLSFEEKVAISHRTRAFTKFLQWLSSTNS